MTNAYFQRGGEELDFPKSVDSTDRKIYPYIPEHSGLIPHDRWQAR